METLLLPHSPTSPIDKVPYVCHDRYDGLPFLAYPIRKGHSKSTQIPQHFELYETIHPTPVAEQQSFFQTWLFFGLLSELFGGNTEALPRDPASTAGLVRSEAILGHIYDDFITVEAGCKYITVAKLLPYVDALVPTISNSLVTFDELKERYIHFKDCLMYAFRKLSTCQIEFDQRIKHSIALVGEVLSYKVNIVIGYKSPSTCPPIWGVGYYNDEIKAAMVHSGWCPSEVARIEDVFKSLQMMHFLSKVDRTQKGRDHSRCTKENCCSYQIDVTNYESEHVDKCDCETLGVDITAIIEILQREGSIPLLKISFENNDLSMLTVEVVERKQETAFVAISHVWADGLGNPRANTLRRCQLARLKTLSSSLGPDLIWLDTLCCPIGPPYAKTLALNKLRDPYIYASHVLVLDKWLLSVAAEPLHFLEQTARIVTSSWMRRLWTLQEGALAKSLWFRFSDKAVLLDSLDDAISQSKDAQHYYYRGMIDDLKLQLLVLAFFFHFEKTGIAEFTGPRLQDLDTALQHRSASVQSDEALCIATLMGISLEEITRVKVPSELQEEGFHERELQVGAETEPLKAGKLAAVDVGKAGETKSITMAQSEDELNKIKDEKLHIARMQKMWELLAHSRGGLPAHIIFSQEPHLPTLGWRWAPYSLLGCHRELGDPPAARIERWRSTQIASPTKLGLRVQFPGLMLKEVTYNDDIPQQPWKGAARLTLPFFFVRVSRLELYLIQEKPSPDFIERSSFYRKTMGVPFEDLARMDVHGIVMNNEIAENTPTDAVSDVGGSNLDMALWTSTGLLSSLDVASATDAETPNTERNKSMVARTQRHVLVVRKSPEEVKFLNIVEDLARKLRRGILTTELQHIAEDSGEENEQRQKEIIEKLKQAMKQEMMDARQNTPGLDDIIRKFWGSGSEDKVWVLISDWFYRIMDGIKCPPDSVWYVD